jgi:hypothetical protein
LAIYLKFATSSRMPEAALQVAYDGEALETGSMDVRELAPALLAIGDLCDRANLILNGSETKVSVNVRADFKRGSFEVHLDVIQIQTVIGAASSFLFPSNLKTATEILEFLFGGGAVMSVVELVKLLRGTPITKKTVVKDGGILIDLTGADFRGTRETIIVASETVRLYEDAPARKSMEQTLKPLEKPGIDRFQVRENARLIQQIDKQEARYFKVSDTLLAQQDNFEADRVGYFRIVTASFEDRYKWRLSDGNATFSADIEDDEFFRRVDSGEIRFGKGDILFADLHTRQWRDDKGLHAEYRVTRVLDVLPAAKSPKLL